MILGFVASHAPSQGSSASTTGQPLVQPSSPTPDGPSVAQAVGALLATDSTDEQRTAAARALVSMRAAGATDGLTRAMSAEAPELAALAAIAAVSEAGLAGTYSGPLSRACDDARASVASAAGVALGGVASPAREFIGAVVRAMARADTAGRRASVWGALVRMTGRDDLPAESGAWDGWWREHGFLPEGEWRVRLATAHAARAQRLARERDSLASRLAEVYGRVYALTPPEERSAMLAAMLRDDSAQVRLIGFDLASRALVNAQVLDTSVADAAMQSLVGGSSDVRAAAARLLANLAPRDVAPALTALRGETDERVAAPLLRLLSNRPDPREAEVCLRWLERGDAARPAAAEALASIHRVSPLEVGLGRRAMELLVRIDPKRISPSSARLLGALSGSEDVDAARRVLSESEPGSRLALAEGLALHDQGLSVLLEIAPEPDGAVFELVCRALAARTATVEWFAMLRSAGAHLGDGRWDGLGRVLLALPPEGFRAALSTVTEPDDRGALLARAAAHATTNGGEATTRVCIARAEHSLSQRDGGAALTHLDALRAAPGDPLVRDARLRALLLLDRLDEAETLQAPVSAWLDGLDLCRGMAHEASVRDRIAALFESTLSGGERDRLYAPASAPERPIAPESDGASRQSAP